MNYLSNSIPSLLLSCEIALFAPFFLFAFPWAPYVIGSVLAADRTPKPRQYYGGFLGLKALLMAANIFDIFMALGKGLIAKFGRGRRSYTGVVQQGNCNLNEDGGAALSR